MTLPLDPLILGSGPGLVLAHGAGSDVRDSFGPLPELLAECHTVVGADYPGSGGVPLPSGPLTLDLLADRLVASADAAGLSTFAVSGFSMGSAVAVRTATRHPDRIDALVLSAGLAAANPRLRLVADTWGALVRAGDSDALASYLSLLVNSRAWLDQRTPEQVREQVLLFGCGTPPGTEAHLELLGGLDVRGELGRVRVPTLVVSPTDDLLLTPADHRRLAAGITGSVLVPIDCGHALASERPREWAEATGRFLASAR
ncbi:alpha/beta fold hydrolase [Nocardiopsis quinghaiensis]|uniref:alpha/beta fold hydrolase n=1 Tax=Nocardiopsis quinghaiensis TaxID=464995 RepID=UPI00123B7403|nr:alpha/beta hydrolase [Nocardiopsis quinghaiensis]